LLHESPVVICWRHDQETKQTLKTNYVSSCCSKKYQGSISHPELGQV
jgi:hypothetical protein